MGNTTKIKGAIKKKVDQGIALGLTQDDIVKTIDGKASQTSISRYIQGLENDRPIIKKFEAIKAEGLARLQMKGQELRGMVYDDLLEGGEKVISGMSTNEKRSLIHSLTVCGGIDTDKQRLLEDKSTVNVSSKSLVSRVATNIDTIMEAVNTIDGD